MRFDNAPERLRRTLFDRDGRAIARHIVAEYPDAGAAIAHAQRDLRDNWQRYRAAFVGDEYGRPVIDPIRASQITERIDQGFDFVQDVIDNPQILETIPNESMLMFRYVLRRVWTMRLTAYLPKHPGARWGARVTGMTPTAIPIDSPSSVTLAPRDDIARLPTVAGHDTAEAALDALEAELGAAERAEPVARRAVGA